jgi:CheY-like chemotaxis protein
MERPVQSQSGIDIAGKFVGLGDDSLQRRANERIAMDIESIVRDLGHNVTGVAVTRDEAVAQARKSTPGLVLADIQLADDSSGIDAVKDILSEFSVPVIFITAFPERLLTGTRPEPTFLITKPFQRSTVKAAISQALFFDAATVPAA